MLSTRTAVCCANIPKRDYFVFKTNSFENILDHCSVIYEDELLKYGELVSDEATGIVRYETNTHGGVVPRKVKESGKSLALSGSSRVIIKEERISKKKKLNAPI